MNDRPQILIIDDDAVFRNLLVSLLRKDYLVAVAKDGQEGYEKAQSFTPSAVVIDIAMPGWNGHETLKAFREDPYLFAVPAMILTASSEKETVLSAIQGGANEYVIKAAFDKEEFLTKIHRLVNNIKSPRKTAAVPAPKAEALANSDQPITTKEQAADWLMEEWN